MAVEAFKSTQQGDDYRGRPTSDHGKLRIEYFELPATTVAGDAESTIDLTQLPPGNVRLLPSMCRLETTAFGSGRSLDIGTRAYSSRNPSAIGAVENAEELDAFIDGKSVATALADEKFSDVIKYDLYSVAGITVAAQVKGGTIPIGAKVSGYLVYVYE